MQVLSISELDFYKKKAIVRVDFNVPMKEDGTIADLMRISESVPTIRYILDRGGSVILLSHLGNLEGSPEKKMNRSLRPCGEALSKLIGKEVLFAEDCLGETTKQQIEALKPGEVILLENLRLYEAEENPSKDPLFAKTLASYGDLYVNNAFGACHRKHSSIVSLPAFFPNSAAAGLLIEKEINALTLLCKNPPKPFHAIIGGSKISSKIGVIEALLTKVDALYIGGGMAFTFLKALGHPIGSSLCEPNFLQTAQTIIHRCFEKKIKLFLPEDAVAALSFSNDSPKKIVNTLKEGIDEGWRAMDIGPKTISSWQQSLQKASSIFWNGPLGVFEFSNFAEGTFSIIHFLSTLSSLRIVGGGDSAAAIHQLGLAQKFTHISTGGGASLTWIEKESLPGIEALTKTETLSS